MRLFTHFQPEQIYPQLLIFSLILLAGEPLFGQICTWYASHNYARSRLAVQMMQKSNADQRELEVLPLVKSLSRVLRREWLLPLLLLVLMLLPIWSTSHAAFGDYSNHLLQANVVLHYTDPNFAYSAGYELVPHWYLNSTALSTLLLVGFGSMIPMELAGQVILSLYLVLFLGGFKLLLDRAGTTWPLLLLAPILAYNLTFTMGFINFSYGVAFGMYALFFYLRWSEKGRSRDLWIVAGLLLLTYLAHILAWALWLMALSAMASVELWQPRRLGALLIAINGALPLLLLTRPILAVAAVLIAPTLWVIGWLLRRLHIPGYLVALAGLGLAVVSYRFRIFARLPDLLQQSILPNAAYNRFDKQVTPLKLFTIPHQFTPPDDVLTIYNVGLLVLVVLLVGLLSWSTLRSPKKPTTPWLRAIGLLGLLYFMIPTRTYDIVFVEPRVLLVLILVVLVAVPQPFNDSRFKHVVTVCVLSLCLVSSAALLYSTQRNDQRVQRWIEQMALMEPARNILVLYNSDQGERNYQNNLRLFNSVYDGRHISSLYAIERGGFVSVTFNNGPLRRRSEMPIPGNWFGFDRAAYVAETCTTLRNAYDAVLVLIDPPEPALTTQLDKCFGPGRNLPDMSIWRP